MIVSSPSAKPVSSWLKKTFSLFFFLTRRLQCDFVEFFWDELYALRLILYLPTHQKCLSLNNVTEIHQKISFVRLLSFARNNECSVELSLYAKTKARKIKNVINFHSAFISKWAFFMKAKFKFIIWAESDWRRELKALNFCTKFDWEKFDFQSRVSGISSGIIWAQRDFAKKKRRTENRNMFFQLVKDLAAKRSEKN